MTELTAQTSGNLTEAQKDAYRLDYEIKAEATNIVNGICRIGKCLKEIKERKLYIELGADSLEAYAEQAVGLKGRAAYNYISAYETYGDEGLQKYGALGITKLAALAQLNDVDRQELLESGKAEELSTRELQEEIKRLKHQNEQLTFELSEAGSNSADVDKLNEEIEALKAALEEEKATKVLPAPVMSEAEKEEIRRSIVEEQEARFEKEIEKEIKEAEKAAAEKAEAEMRKKLKAEAEKVSKLKTDKEALETKLKQIGEEKVNKLKADNEKLIAEKEAESSRLKAEIEKLTAENSKLQATAQKAPPSDKKELLKFICKEIIGKAKEIPGIVAELPEEEKEGAVKAVRAVANAITGELGRI